MSTPVNGVVVYSDIDPAAVAAAPVGVKVIDVYGANGGLFTNAQVTQMESGGGSLLGYFDIGEAESYRPYFSSLPSSVLGPQTSPGVYEAAYWTTTWLNVAENYVQTMINGGYQGAFFDLVDQAETSWAVQNAPGGTLSSAEGAMTSLIQEVASYAHSKDPNFQIWINSSGAYDMLSNSTLVNTISGAIEESLYYQNPTTPQPADGTSTVVAELDHVTAAGKPVIDIEYVSGASEVANAEAQAKADGFGYYIANPNQALDGIDTQGFPSSPPAGSAPTLSIASSSIKVSGSGGTVGLGVGVTAPASATATTTTVTIAGLPGYERITDALDGRIFRGSSVTLTGAEVDSGLTLTSSYRGSGSPSATLTITASDTISGVAYTSAAKTILVQDPPPDSGDLAKALSAIQPVWTASPWVAPQASGDAPGGADLASLLADHGGASWDPGRLAPVWDARLGTVAASDLHRL